MIHSRRQLLTGLVLACSLRRAHAQERKRRVAVLNGVTRYAEAEALIASFRDKLADLGWRLGSNLELEAGGPLRAPIAPERLHRSFWNGSPMLFWRGTPSPSKSC